MKINTDEITTLIKQEVANYDTQLDVSQVGTVVEVGDGIARIYGLSNAMAGEMLEFETESGEPVRGQHFQPRLHLSHPCIHENRLPVSADQW